MPRNQLHCSHSPPPQLWTDERAYTESFDKSDLVYLTSDSPNTMTTFDRTKASRSSDSDSGSGSAPPPPIPSQKYLPHLQSPSPSPHISPYLTISSTFAIAVRARITSIGNGYWR